MFKSFYVKNYKSWKSGVYIDMVGESISEHPENYVKVKKGKEKILKNLVIYGANASGKSNLLEAIQFMYQKVMEIYNEREWNKNIPPEIRNNALVNILSFKRPHCATYANKPLESEFEITFLHNDDEYSYGFTLKQNIITNEWFEKNNKTIIFDRKTKNFMRINEYKFITDKVPDDELYLSYIISYAKIKSGDPLNYVSNFFKKMGIFRDIEKLDDQVLNFMLLNAFNNNISLIEKLNGFFEIIDFGIKKIEVDKIQNQIYFQHKGKNEVFKVYLPNESLGTKKSLLFLIGVVERLEHGGLIVADEFNSSLHPLLSKLFLDMISNPKMNKGNAQLIFSSHDVYLLRKEQFRRDEIGFVYKDNTGESKYHRLYDVKDKDLNRVRKDATYWKNYISGSYLGTPDVNYDMFINEEGVLYGKKQKTK